MRIWNIQIIWIALHHLTSHNCSQCIVHWASNDDCSCYNSRVCASDRQNQEHLIYLEVNGYTANRDKSQNKHGGEKERFKEECCICDVSLRRSFHLKRLLHNNDLKIQALLRVQVIRYAQKVSAKWPLWVDTASVYTFTKLCWNSRRHITLNRWKEHGHTEHVQKHSSDIHMKSVNHYFHNHNKITDKRPVTTGRPTASYLNLSLCCG